MRVLLVDNHDSYTYNLFHLISRVTGHEPTVVTNDELRWDSSRSASVDAAVISPGPGRPQNPRDMGNVWDLLADPDIPILGVCLGHQAIAYLAGAPVCSAPAARHGHLSSIHHTQTDLFASIPQNFTAVRYHSLAVPTTLPEPLTATAWADDGVVMGLQHDTLPRWGVQFHPESVASQYGYQLIANFLQQAHQHRNPPPLPPGQATTSHPRSSRPEQSTEHSARVATLPYAIDTEAAFTHLYSDSTHAFWLDSSYHGDTGRFSFLGDNRPGGEVLTYRTTDGSVTVEREGGVSHQEPGTIFDALRRRVAPHPRASALPFDFAGGYIGYFGYELKTDCGADTRHRAHTPDAVWLRCERFVAVDHAQERTYVVAIDAGEDAPTWVENTHTRLTDLPPAESPTVAGDLPDVETTLERSRQEYLADVETCLDCLTAGESYEICLTNRLRLPAPKDDLAFYRRLRQSRPAPYAALLRLGETAVISASPERFLRITGDGEADSRPIKGTAPRHADPDTDARNAAELRTSAKTRAENLMIVDLLRNDLGRVCDTGSVHVPAFMYTVSYSTVHQLISTVRGRLRPDVSAVDAVRACFPGGSMTGAPKERTMEIIDRLEHSARGVYSGALGYLSDTGTTDLSIVIRTAVRTGSEITVGAGGAIVLDSAPGEEYEEMLLKAAVALEGY